ncbi:MAG TPA: polyprenol monophosphomannose synthase [Microthrixaceae bacterium]|nr:polyprenol monophosphomannose synthase [Microthrixaceae bacterium]HNI35424.1 polyprenol monophosphomannose synthase [Microthrixaceae bacterium]
MPTALVVPTYQEAGNIERFLKEVRSALPDMTVFVCDDNSPDGTGAIAERIGAELGNIEVVHRHAKEGLGAAYRHGFDHALDAGFDVILQMDVDFSHDPSLLPQFESAIREGFDVAVGSRYVPGGATPDWPLRRRMLSRYGNEYARAALRLGMHDATSGYRGYRADMLRAIHFETTRSNGYGFMIETGYRLTAAGAKVREIPIVFHDRTEGESKMSVPIMAETMLSVTWWGTCIRAPRLTDRFRATKLGRRLWSFTGPSSSPR